MFGSSHTIGVTTYTYDSTSDDGTYQTDVYTDGNGASLDLRSRIGASETLAEVSGAFTGFFYNGSIQPLIDQSTPESITFTSPNGRVYTERFDRTTYAVDLDQDSVTSSSVTVYAGAQGEFFVPVNGEDGGVTGAENGYVVNGSLLLDETTTSSWTLAQANSPMQLFGSTYYRTHAVMTTGYNASGEGWSSSTTTYQSAGSGSFVVNESADLYNSGSDASGNDPYVGNWSATGSLSEFEPLDGAVFAPQAFWVNGKVVQWNESLITSTDGTIVSSFSSGDGITVTITGNARQFSELQQTAAVEVSIDGGDLFTGTLSPAGVVQGFNAAECDVQLTDPNRQTPLFAPGVLYVDGVPFGFIGGYESSTGTRTDLYDHDGAVLSMVGAVSTPGTAAVRLGVEEGSFLNGVFDMAECVILSTPVEGPPAFWVNGVLFTKAPDSAAYVSASSSPQWFSLSGEQAEALTLTGTLAGGAALTGTYNAVQGGVFNVTLGGVSRIACPAETSGAPRQGPALDSLNGAEGPHPEFAGLPAAVRVPVTIPAGTETQRLDVVLDFLGLAEDDTGSNGLVACYGRSSEEATAAPEGYWQQHLVLLKISSASAGAIKDVTMRDYHGATTTDGTYDTSSRLFQTALRASNAPVQPLPLPVMSLERPTYAFWFIDAPTGGLPRSFIIRGQPWWYAGESGGQPVYRGFYAGQQMSLGTPDASGQRSVSLTDPAFQNGATTQGTLSADRRSVRLRDGTLALSGRDDGTQQTVTPIDDYSLHTIRSDLDILGNNLSFGVLNNDASLAGALFSFVDQGAGAPVTLHQVLSRDEAQWVWWKALAANGKTDWFPVMMVDENHVLRLYPKTLSEFPAILLNPEGTSSFKGPVRIPKGGDIPMGIYQAGGAP